ncbi:MAG TPA: hypothetical protein VNZ49_09660 [Bacteroidia bacterium]|jgi:hypothetical protein|nr:hypothetical protein [Bacteroidia bacterium]
MRKLFSDNNKIFLLFLSLSFLFYGNCIKNGFNFDDSYVTVTNYPVNGQNYIPNHPLVAKGIKGIPEIWKSRYGHEFDGSFDYRPVVITFFALEYAVFGQSPYINHVSNIFLYAILIFYIFKVLRLCMTQYSFREPFAFISSLLFLTHPVHSEVVNNIKCCDEILTFLFGVLTLFHLLKYYESKQVKFLFFSVIFILLAYFTKVSSVVFIVLIPLTLIFFIGVRKKQAVFIFVALLFLFATHNWVRNMIVTEKEVRYFFHFENPLFTEHVSLFTKILFTLKTLGAYIKLLFIPYPLRFYYGTDMLSVHTSILNTEIILSVIFLVSAAYYCYRTKNKVALFGLIFFLISIAPFSNLVRPAAGILGERFCFTASLGFILIIVSVLFSFYKTAPTHINFSLFTGKPVSRLGILIIFFLIYTWNRNTVWKDEITLYEHDVPYSEKSAGANNLLANRYFERLSFSSGKYPQEELIEKCLYHYKLAFTNDSSVYTALNNTGVIIFFFRHRADLALSYFERAVNVMPVYPQAYENIGDCYEAMSKPQEALIFYQKAISQNSKQYRSYLQMIRILSHEKKNEEVFNLLRKADTQFPNDFQLVIEKGNYYLAGKQYKEAAFEFEKAYALRQTRNLAYSLLTTYRYLHNEEKVRYYKNAFETTGK